MENDSMTLQEDFFGYIQKDVEKYHPSWTRRATEQWYNCYSQIGGRERVILWVKQPNKDGSFWIFVSISSSQISKISDIIFKQDMRDNRKFHISLKNTSMTPIELLDRGLSAKNPWETNWPVGFKIIDKTQFELAKKIVPKQWM
jgi:hypothetical protein